MSMLIKTKRTLLRDFEESDLNDLFELLYQQKDDKFEGYPGITLDGAKNHLKTRLKTKEYLAIEYDGKVIGNILVGQRLFEAKEVGYLINKNYRNQGFAKEALLAVIKHEFDNGTHRLYAECDPDNTASWKLLESCGFAKEAHFKNCIYFEKDKNGEPIWRDMVVYSLIKTEEPNGDKVCRCRRSLAGS